MKKIIPLIIIIFVLALVVNSLEERVTNTTEITQSFANIEIECDTENVSILPSTDGVCRVVTVEDKKRPGEVTVVDDTLKITVSDNRTFFDYLSVNFKSTSVEVYLPLDVYGSLNVSVSTGNVNVYGAFNFKSADVTLSTGTAEFSSSVDGHLMIVATTGDITAKNITVGALSLIVTTGDVEAVEVNSLGDATLSVTTGDAFVTGLTCKSFSSSGSTGDVNISQLVADEKISIKRSTGNVRLENIDAAKIKIETTTGSVTGSVLSEKSFYASSTTGRIDVPKTSGEICEINTTTGNIIITVAE